MTPAKNASLLERLEGLRERAREAEARVAELEAERTQSVRALEAARAPLADYYEALGAGERDPDPGEEAKLVDAIREAERLVTLRVVPAARGDGFGLEAVDERVERLLAGARRTVDARRQDVSRFLRSHRDALAGELAVEATAARDDVVAALPALLDAEERYRRIRAKWRPLLEANGLPADLPPNPLRGFADELDNVDGVPAPIPASLADRIER